MTGRKPGSGPGRIEVELPHWAAAVTVCDPALRPVVELDTVREIPSKPGVYQTAGAVAAGIYLVEVTLGEQRQRELVGVFPGHTARIERETWRLEFTSVAPLTGLDHPRLAAQRKAAQETSRRPTWTSPEGAASSRLFLFVRTTNPKRYPHFGEGLQLLDADHRPVVDLHPQADKSATDGWLAFAGEMPAGYYVLRCGRSGVPVRYQPIYLHKGWVTQVFLAARGYPSLRKQSMAMAPMGTGFSAEDETVMATEALLASLDSPDNETPIVNNRKLLELLQRSHENPWLDVVAAYSLRGWLSTGDHIDSPLAALLPKLVDSAARIGDHPDARALQLDDDMPAERPFWQPPLLRAGLARVNQHAIRHADTVPLDCLTDCVLDNVITNSMWTAWHNLDRLPRPERLTQATAAQPVIEIRRAEEPSQLAAIGPPLASTTLRFLESDSPPPAADDAAEAVVTPAPADRLLLAPLVNSAEGIIAVYGFSALPERVPLSPARQLDDQLAQVEPAAVSAASGLPLARTEEGVKQLRQRLANDLDPATPSSTAPLPAAQREIVRYVLLNSRPPAGSAEADPTPGSAGPPAPDDVVTGLRAEENRLRHRAADPEWKREGGNPKAARELADRLQRVADKLLKGADFIALTVPEHHLILGNAAFDDLVGQPAETPTGTIRPQERRRSLSAWDRSLARQKPGHSVLPTPTENRIATEWELQRSALVDTDGQPRAYLNMLRGLGASPPGSTLERAEAPLPEIRTYASLYAYGSGELRDEYAERLRAVTEALESAVIEP